MVQPFTALDDPAAGSWIAPRLGPFGGDVGSVVPHGFEAYARVLHPVEVRGGTTSWAAVCEVTGRRAHPLMQWEDISAPAWSRGEPDTGNLAPEPLGRLVDVLTGYTAVDAQCIFAIWDGYGWGEGTRATVFFQSTASPATPAPMPPPGPPVLPPEVINGPRLRLPHRDYYLATGPLRAALELGHWPTADWFLPQSPTLFWPPDRSWVVATEIDFDSTLVAGSSQLISDLLSQPQLETWSVGPHDSLARDGDVINGSGR